MHPSRAEVVAFRMAAHHLTERRPVEALLEVAGACGVQDSPPGSALTALGARVRDLTPATLDDALTRDKTLLRTWSLRGAPYVVPTELASVFTTGVLPPDEQALRHFLPGAAPSVDRLGMGLTEAAHLTSVEVSVVLSGRRLAVDELGVEVATRVARSLAPRQRGVWESEGPYAAGQPLGEGIVHFCLRVLALRQVVCFGPRDGAKAPFVLLDEWLGHPVPPLDPVAARAELLRHYLHCHGPSTPAHIAAWLGLRVGAVGPWWAPVEDELTHTRYGGGSWMLTRDVEAMRSAAPPRGVRLLPPSDPYTQTRDRDVLADPRHHREVWKAVGSPGVVLVDGAVAGTWRSRRTGRTVTFTVDLFESLSPALLGELNAETNRLALLRGTSAAVVQLR